MLSRRDLFKCIASLAVSGIAAKCLPQVERIVEQLSGPIPKQVPTVVSTVIRVPVIVQRKLIELPDDLWAPLYDRVNYPIVGGVGWLR